MQDAVSKAISQMGIGQVSTELNRLTGSEALTSALLQLTNTQSEELRLLLHFYLLENKASRTDLRKLGVSRNISSMEDRFGTLAAILHLLIGLEPKDELQQHNRLILWIDEMEDLINYPVRYYRPFTQAIRDMLGKIPYYFSLLMNCTLASPEAFEDVTVILGEALMSRVTNRIDFKPLSLTEAKEYVIDLLGQYRPAGSYHPEYPFDEDGLESALSSLPDIDRTPREINKRCRTLIVAAIQSGDINPNEESRIINRSFVEHYDAAMAEAL
jgi:hypothetical protein